MPDTYINGNSDRENCLPCSDVTLGLICLLVGVASGLGAAGFKFSLHTVHHLASLVRDNYLADSPWVALLPALGGLVVGLMIYFLTRGHPGEGVPDVMLEVARGRGALGVKSPVVRTVAAAITIGSGGSAGPEGPAVHIGSVLGSWVGQLFRLPHWQLVKLVAAGAAGGLAAVFNAPIAGVVFALEAILGYFDVRNLSFAVLSAFVASRLSRYLWGNHPILGMEVTLSNRLPELLSFAVLGLLGGLVAALFITTLDRLEDFFHDLPLLPPWVRPALGGMLVGGMGLYLPGILSEGYDFMALAMTGQYALALVAALLLGKILATSLTLGSGGSGGVFAPSLYMGAMLGVAFCNLLQPLFPGLISSPAAYGVAGMAAVLGSAFQAPLTAMVMMVELTGNYQAVLPIMLATAMAEFTSYWLLKGTSIYTFRMTRKGIDIHRLQARNFARHAMEETCAYRERCGARQVPR